MSVLFIGFYEILQSVHVLYVHMYIHFFVISMLLNIILLIGPPCHTIGIDFYECSIYRFL